MNQTVTCDAVRLEGAQRLTFLPDLFGGDFMTSEASVYAYAQRYWGLKANRTRTYAKYIF